MNLCFGLFCRAGVLCSSELGFDFFAFVQKCLTKKLEQKAIDSYSYMFSCLVSVHSKM